MRMSSCRLFQNESVTGNTLAQHQRQALWQSIPRLQPKEQPPVQLPMMHGNRAKRGRSENDVNRFVLQVWARLTLKAFMIIGRSLQHRVQHHLKIPGPRGVLA